MNESLLELVRDWLAVALPTSEQENKRLPTLSEALTRIERGDLNAVSFLPRHALVIGGLQKQDSALQALNPQALIMAVVDTVTQGPMQREFMRCLFTSMFYQDQAVLVDLLEHIDANEVQLALETASRALNRDHLSTINPDILKVFNSACDLYDID